jgi:pimeloyl-ACP methyl ester carboxylesterase
MSMITTTDDAGSVTAVPGLPTGFTDTFTSLRVDTGPTRLHVVAGGSGPPVLLLPGWPQTWFTWRHLMPALARRHSVVAADPRGTGLSDAPDTGYDTATLATDLAKTMSVLGHQRFAIVGFDLGMLLGYAVAADHPERVTRLAVGEAARGFLPAPSMLAPKPIAEKAWHFAFNRAGEISEQLVRGREEVYFGHQFRSKAASPNVIASEVIDVYVSPLKASPATLRASFEYYREDLTDVQQEKRRQTPLTVPVLVFGGEKSMGDMLGAVMGDLATCVTTAVIPGAGHFVPDESPDALLTELRAFLSEEQVSSY